MSPHSTYEQKRNTEFARLVRRHSLAVEQGQRAAEAGHAKTADGCLKIASAYLVQIEEHCREDQSNAQLKQRTDIANRLHAAMAVKDRDRIRDLTAELVSIDAQISAA